MPSEISYVKAVKILHHYFAGMPQLTIAQKCLVNQSTVSRCAEKFEKEASAKGIMAAAMEYKIMSEVTTLRSLATDLYKSKVSIEEAKAGLKMVVLFNSLDVAPEEYKLLAKMFKKLKDPEFLKTGMKLVKLEELTGKNYAEIVSEFEKLGEEIAKRQEAVATLKEKQEKEEKSLEELEIARGNKKAELAEFLKEVEQKKAAADAGVNEKLTETGLALEKVAKVHPVVEKLNALGITDDKLETFVKEHQILEEQGVAWEKFKIVAEALAKAGEINGEGLAAKLAEYGTLDQSIISMKAEKESLEPQVEGLKKERSYLETQVDEQAKKKSYLEDEVKHLEEVKDTLNKAISALPNLEKLVTKMEKETAEREARNMALVKEVAQKEKQVAEMDEKLTAAGDLDKEIGEKKEQVRELDAQVAMAGQKYKLFESFLGLVSAKSTAEVELFLTTAGTLINEAKAGNYDPAYLVDQVIGQLTGGTFDLTVCQECEAEFIIVESGKKQLPGGVSVINQRCPKCGGIHTIVKKKLLVPTLKSVIISKTQIILGKPGKITYGEKLRGRIVANKE